MIDYEALWEALPFPAILVDKEIKVLGANAGAEQLAGGSLPQLIRRGLAKYFGKDSVVVSMLNQVRDEQASMVQYGVAVTTGEQTSIPCNIHVNLMQDGSDNMLMVIQPTSVAEKMSASIDHLNAARSVAAMAGMLSHEIRNPLAGITGAAQLLAMNISEEDQEFTLMIRDEAKRIGDLVNRVEHFGDQRPAAQNPVNIHDVMDRSIRAARAGYAADVPIRVEYDPSLPEAAGEADQLMQVFQNLLKNAAEACDGVRNPSILVRSSYHSGVKYNITGGAPQNLPLQIEIIDTGKGIPPSLMADIFDPFITSKSNGSGLGLSLVSKIIASHGGLIECASDEDRTTFRIRLPVWRKPKE